MKVIKIIVLLLLFSSLSYSEEDELDIADESLDEKTVYHFAVSMTAAYLTETLLHQASGLSDA